MAASLLTVLAFASGLALIVAGITWIYPPAGLITAGLIATLTAVGYRRGSEEPDA